MATDSFISKLTAKSQTVIPLAIRNRLGLQPGDMIRYRIHGKKIELEKLDPNAAQDDPFTTFTEWASAADEDAYKSL
jgi:antitoxin PrlF